MLSLHSFKKKDVNFPFAHMTLKMALISSTQWVDGGGLRGAAKAEGA